MTMIKGETDKVDQVDNSITVQSNSVGESASTSQGDCLASVCKTF